MSRSLHRLRFHSPRYGCGTLYFQPDGRPGGVHTMRGNSVNSPSKRVLPARSRAGVHATIGSVTRLSPEPDDRKQLRRAVIASTVGTTIEWYDFFLYST